ncbi:Poly(ADP-ribose) glycohydrolase ARH3 [Trichoplax sp. H2]|nr:Poly(ADP-ribose) glycohydrolase ARH3 [Trichoplax sp. H2]|eukprot:RDD43150.1 Poly(ADP-ribose) glycohydrolase ARH3 [Trichoplax sp. H2]
MATPTGEASNRLYDQFCGCLVGAVLGDCFGAPFEDIPFDSISLDSVQRFTRQDYKKKQILLYTDDTAMARSIADSLLSNYGFNGSDLARRFTEEYFHDPSRYYGGHIPIVFGNLQASNYTDPEGPASQQFNGSGSFGNGSGMRVAPVALFAYNASIEDAQALAAKTSRITHTHPNGVNGAIMQMLAVRESLTMDAAQGLDVYAFLDKMLIYMEDIEHTLPTTVTASMEGMDEKEKNVYRLTHLKNSNTSMQGRCSTYVESLVRMYRLLQKSKSVKTKSVYRALGNGITAIEAIPAALMAFLCVACEPKNTFMDVIEYAIALGNDTDTIATMAGAIAGGYYGYNSLPKDWIEKCEGSSYAFDQAEKLFNYLHGQTVEFDQEQQLQIISRNNIAAGLATHSSNTKMVTMTRAASNRLRNKFHGCLVGAVLGDCLGAIFENDTFQSIPIEKVQKFTREGYKKQQELFYTDDTAMARSVADSLLSKNGFHGSDMAKRFTEEYFHNPYRGYGGNVPTVFSKLRDSNYADPEGPASQQFDGSGSYGNGSAMRVAPVALFAYHDPVEEAQTIAAKTSRITHTHPDGVNGAIMQMLAVRESVILNVSQGLDVFAFLDKMLIYMEDIEHTLPTNAIAAIERMDEAEKNARRLSQLKNSDTSMENRCSSYVESLVRMCRLFQESKSINSEVVYRTFGNGIAAIEAVPAALMAFLCIACEPKSSFMDVIEYAISLGGDTDTIATMAGAIAGGYYGCDSIPNGWIEKCEGTAYALQRADNLFGYAVQRYTFIS